MLMSNSNVSISSDLFRNESVYMPLSVRLYGSDESLLVNSCVQVCAPFKLEKLWLWKQPFLKWLALSFHMTSYDIDFSILLLFSYRYGSFGTDSRRWYDFDTKRGWHLSSYYIDNYIILAIYIEVYRYIIRLLYQLL